MQIGYKTNDKQYIIYIVGGGVYYDISVCLEDKIKIVNNYDK